MYALTGASGHLGRLVIQNLLENVPANQILATTREPEKLADFAAQGVVVRHADLDSPAGLPAAFEGATSLLIISTVAENRAEQHKAAIDAAAQVGVKHLVYTSAPGADSNSPFFILQSHGVTEEDLQASGVAYTALRNNIYTNTLAGTIGLLSGDGKLFTLSGDGKPVWISREDCAKIAAVALYDESVPTGAVEVTGPEALGLPELAVRLSQLQGKEIVSETLSEEEMVAHLGTKGMPPEAAGGFMPILKWFTQGEFGPVSGSFEKITGVKPAPVDAILAPESVA